MEISRLQQFRAIVDAGGLLRASEILGISGGGLSKSMRVLEQDLGYAVFLQKGRGLELTEKGRRLYERLPSFLKTFEELLRPQAGTAPAREPLRIASFEVFTTHFLARALMRNPVDRPVEIREAIPGQMESFVAEGQSDLGITYIPVPHARVEFTKVGRARMGIFGAKGRWHRARLEDLPFAIPVTPLTGMPSGVRGLDGWPEHLFERRAQFRVEMMETALQLARLGTAVSFLPDFVVRLVNQTASADSQLSEIPLPPALGKVHRDLFLIHRKGAEETPAIREIARALRKI